MLQAGAGAGLEALAARLQQEQAEFMAQQRARRATPLGTRQSLTSVSAAKHMQPAQEQRQQQRDVFGLLQAQQRSQEQLPSPVSPAAAEEPEMPCSSTFQVPQEEGASRLASNATADFPGFGSRADSPVPSTHGRAGGGALGGGYRSTEFRSSGDVAAGGSYGAASGGGLGGGGFMGVEGAADVGLRDSAAGLRGSHASGGSWMRELRPADAAGRAATAGAGAGKATGLGPPQHSGAAGPQEEGQSSAASRQRQGGIERQVVPEEAAAVDAGGLDRNHTRSGSSEGNDPVPQPRALPAHLKFNRAASQQGVTSSVGLQQQQQKIGVPPGASSRGSGASDGRGQEEVAPVAAAVGPGARGVQPRDEAVQTAAAAALRETAHPKVAGAEAGRATGDAALERGAGVQLLQQQQDEQHQQEHYMRQQQQKRPQHQLQQHGAVGHEGQQQHGVGHDPQAQYPSRVPLQGLEERGVVQQQQTQQQRQQSDQGLRQQDLRDRSRSKVVTQGAGDGAAAAAGFEKGGSNLPEEPAVQVELNSTRLLTNRIQVWACICRATGTGSMCWQQFAFTPFQA